MSIDSHEGDNYFIQKIVVKGGWRHNGWWESFLRGLSIKGDILPIWCWGIGFVIGNRSFLIHFCDSIAQSWVLQDDILRDRSIYYINSNFDRALDGLSGAISNFQFSRFTNKDIVPPKPNMIWKVPFLV